MCMRAQGNWTYCLYTKSRIKQLAEENGKNNYCTKIRKMERKKETEIFIT